MREVTQQLPIAYRGRRTSRGAILDSSRPPPPDTPSTPVYTCATTRRVASAASRLPETLALTVYQRLKRALVASLDHAWHLPSDRLDALLAELLSAGIAADLERLFGLPGASTALS